MAYDVYSKDRVCYEISAEVVALYVGKLKLGKASGLDGVETEHILLWNLGKPSTIRPTVSSRQNIPAV